MEENRRKEREAPFSLSSQGHHKEGKGASFRFYRGLGHEGGPNKGPLDFSILFS